MKKLNSRGIVLVNVLALAIIKGAAFDVFDFVDPLIGKKK
jgi:hypothetical protein